MLGMGWVEIFVIVVIALLVIGPDKLPEVARGLAKTLRHVQRIVGDIRDSVNLDELDAMTRDEAPTERPGPSQQPSRLSRGAGRAGSVDDDDDEDPYGDFDEPGDFSALRPMAEKSVSHPADVPPPSAISPPDPALTPVSPPALGKTDAS